MRIPKNSHCKLIYQWKIAESCVRDPLFVRWSGVRVSWHKRTEEVHIVCTTNDQRQCIIDRIGEEPQKEIVVRNYRPGVYHNIPQDSKATLVKNGVMIVPYGDIMQFVFPSQQLRASFERSFLSKSTA